MTTISQVPPKRSVQTVGVIVSEESPAAGGHRR